MQKQLLLSVQGKFFFTSLTRVQRFVSHVFNRGGIRHAGFTTTTTAKASSYISKISIQSNPNGGNSLIVKGEPVKTPSQIPMEIPSYPICELVLAEWNGNLGLIKEKPTPVVLPAISFVCINFWILADFFSLSCLGFKSFTGKKKYTGKRIG